MASMLSYLESSDQPMERQKDWLNPDKDITNSLSLAKALFASDLQTCQSDLIELFSMGSNEKKNSNI